MSVHDPFDKELRQIIAADLRCSNITPEDDQIWQLETSKGEPPGLALQTTYGLRAYSIRIFPRFSINKIPVSDPRAFSAKPDVIFSAPNFLELQYAPFSTLDVVQKVWVPDSHTLTAQLTLTNQNSDLIQLWMEWIVQLNPLHTGSPMTAAQISVNTVLQGQTGSLYPVFLLTGGPRGDLSAFPSLGIEVSLPPHASRQFTWALATLESTEDSFYAARKATAYTLDNEQIKIKMLQKGQSFSFDFPDPLINQLIEKSQQRLFQLLLPPYRNLEQPWVVAKRDPDHGNLPAEANSSFSANWGIQKMTDLWGLSRLLLPSRPDLVKGMLQNLVNQQGADGVLYAQMNWNGRVTNLAAAPLAASLAVDVFESIEDKDWLAQIYPALIRAVKIWFQPVNDRDADGWPEWQHLLQTGLDEGLPLALKEQLEVLIKTAEWPSLAALLINEYRALKKMAVWLNDLADLDWLDDQIQRLEKALQESWDPKRGFFALRDQNGHFSVQAKKLRVFKQNGSVEAAVTFEHPSQLVIRLNTSGHDGLAVECKIKGVAAHHEKTIRLTARDFRMQDGLGVFISEEAFSRVKTIVVSGLKKGEVLSIETPDHFVMSPDLLIPIWAGITTSKQAEKLIVVVDRLLEGMQDSLPFYLKVMWLEALIKTGRKDLASQTLQKWYLNAAPQGAGVFSTAGSGLEELIPLKTLLQLLGVEKITDQELILNGFNEFFPKVNVQYKKFILDLDSHQSRIENLNGESVIINEPGPHRIMLS